MVNINRWKVGKRLTFGFGLMLLLGVFMTLLQVWGTESVIASQKTIYEDRTQPLHDLSEISYAMSRSRIVLMDAVMQADAATTDKRVGQYRDMRTKADKHWKAYLATYLTPEEKLLADDGQKHFRALVDNGFDPLAAALSAGDAAGTKAGLSSVSKLNPAFTDNMEKLIDLQNRVAAEEYAASVALASKLHWATAIAAVVTLLLGTVVGVAITRGIVGALGAEPDELAAVSGRIADGDLGDDGRAPARAGSVMASMQAMRGALVKVVGSVRNGVDHVATASAQIAQGNVDLSSRTEEQASSLQQTAASMEQLTGAVRTSADNARQANQLASGAANLRLAPVPPAPSQTHARYRGRPGTAIAVVTLSSFPATAPGERNVVRVRHDGRWVALGEVPTDAAGNGRGIFEVPKDGALPERIVVARERGASGAEPGGTVVAAWPEGAP